MLSINRFDVEVVQWGPVWLHRFSCHVQDGKKHLNQCGRRLGRTRCGRTSSQAETCWFWQAAGMSKNCWQKSALWLYLLDCSVILELSNFLLLWRQGADRCWNRYESTGENQRKPLESSISNPALVVSEVLWVFEHCALPFLDLCPLLFSFWAVNFC